MFRNILSSRKNNKKVACPFSYPMLWFYLQSVTSVKSWFTPLMVTLISLTLVNGVLQGDTLGPFLFHNLLELCFMNVNFTLKKKTRSRNYDRYRLCKWSGLVPLFNGISTFMGYLMLKPSFRRTAVILSNPYIWESKRVHTFSKGISPTMNEIKWLEFELATSKLLSSTLAITLWRLPRRWSNTSCKYTCTSWNSAS